jgi:PAS domain S-box-containing protein
MKKTEPKSKKNSGTRRQLKKDVPKSAESIADISLVEAEGARLATFPQLNPNPVAEVDFAGQIHYLNPAAERLFPSLRQRGTGHPWLVDWESLVRNLREGGTNVIVREVKVGARWCQQTLHLVEETRRTRIYGTDITERKRAEEELKRLNRTLKAISDSSQAMMRSTNETELLHEVCRIIVEDCGHAMVWIGYAEDDEGKTVRPAAYAGFEEGYIQKLNVTWADTERGRGPTGTAIRTGKPSACRNMLTDPLFKPWREEAINRGYASSIVLPLMAGGEAFGAVNIYSREPDPFSADEVKLLSELAEDLAYGITVMRFRAVYEKAEEALRRSEKRYRHIVEDSAELIGRGTIDGTLTFVNEAWIRNLGGDKSAYIGHNIREFIPPKDQEKIDPLMSSFNPGNISQEIEGRMILPSGESRWYLWNIQAIYDRKGSFIEFQGLSRDITKRKQSERILAERTAQLEEANKELESFSYSVSHDLRAPLRAIDGYARLILKKQGDNFDADTLDKFNTIRSSTHLMGQLIDDLLTFSRLGKKHMSMSKLNMDDIIQDVWKEQQTINPERNMTLTIHSMPPGYGDRALIKQVYSNLLGNAVKFTKNRDAAHIEAGGCTENGEDIFYVKDNGVGFDMTYYDKLFGIFQRLHSTDDFEGTGVGLAIIQRIIHRHGGRVWAEGKVGEGAVFYFSLPENRESYLHM